MFDLRNRRRSHVNDSQHSTRTHRTPSFHTLLARICENCAVGLIPLLARGSLRCLSATAPSVNVDVNWEANVCHHVQQSVTTTKISSHTVNTTHSNSVVLEFALAESFVGGREMGSLEAGQVFMSSGNQKPVSHRQSSSPKKKRLKEKTEQMQVRCALSVKQRQRPRAAEPATHNAKENKLTQTATRAREAASG